MHLSLNVLRELSGTILGRDWLRTNGNILWRRGKPKPQPPAESFRAVARCYSGEPIETLVVWTEHGATTEVTFLEGDRASLTLILPFAEVDRLIEQLQGARTIVNGQSGRFVMPRSTTRKLSMRVTKVTPQTIKEAGDEQEVSSVELGLYPDLRSARPPRSVAAGAPTVRDAVKSASACGRCVSG